MISQQAIFLSQEHYLDLRQEAAQERLIQAAGLSRSSKWMQVGRVLEPLRRSLSMFQGFPEAVVLAKHAG